MRLPRLTLPGIPQMVEIKGNHWETIFNTDHDYRMCLDYLRHACKKYHCSIHAYTLMPNKIYLFVTPMQKAGVSRMLQLFSRLYVRYYNTQNNRSGSLFSGRYKSALVDRSQFGLACCQYIDTYAFCEGFSSSLDSYNWSSYAANAVNFPDVLVTPIDEYYALGSDENSRTKNYAQRCKVPLYKATIDTIQQQTEKSRVVGREKFISSIERLLGVDLEGKSRGGDRRSSLYRRQSNYKWASE